MPDSIHTDQCLCSLVLSALCFCYCVVCRCWIGGVVGLWMVGLECVSASGTTVPKVGRRTGAISMGPYDEGGLLPGAVTFFPSSAPYWVSFACFC